MVRWGFNKFDSLIFNLSMLITCTLRFLMISQKEIRGVIYLSFTGHVVLYMGVCATFVPRGAFYTPDIGDSSILHAVCFFKIHLEFNMANLTLTRSYSQQTLA
jgi:hypothetical protein